MKTRQISSAKTLSSPVWNVGLTQDVQMQNITIVPFSCDGLKVHHPTHEQDAALNLALCGFLRSFLHKKSVVLEEKTSIAATFGLSCWNMLIHFPLLCLYSKYEARFSNSWPIWRDHLPKWSCIVSCWLRLLSHVVPSKTEHTLLWVPGICTLKIVCSKRRVCVPASRLNRLVRGLYAKLSHLLVTASFLLYRHGSAVTLYSQCSTSKTNKRWKYFFNVDTERPGPTLSSAKAVQFVFISLNSRSGLIKIRILLIW